MIFYSREYYERTNSLVQQYIYIDRLLDSSLPHDLLNEYNHETGIGSSSATFREDVDVPDTITEESGTPKPNGDPQKVGPDGLAKKVKRTPRDLYKVSDERTPLLGFEGADDDFDGPKPEIPGMEDDSVESGDAIVKLAIYVNLAANLILLLGKIVVIVLTNSLSVLASLVDAVLDMLSTLIVWSKFFLFSRRFGNMPSFLLPASQLVDYLTLVPHL